MVSRKNKVITVLLMVIIGTCMHFVMEHVPSGPLASLLGHIFPVNETSWEHMKMIWYPFLTAGIIHSCKTKDRGYFASFIVSAIMSMLMQLGAFSIYQSFTGTSVLILDIIIYMASMIFCILIAFDYSQKDWAKKAFPFWLLLALFITASIVYLTYFPSDGYVFLDNEGYQET